MRGSSASGWGPAASSSASTATPRRRSRSQELAEELECETRFIRADFADALVDLAGQGLRADLVYMDLGISSLQLDVAERGFSYTYDAPLDMRMDSGQALSAAEVVNEWPQDRLAGVIREHGDERHARAIAREIVRRRPLETTADLVETIRAAVPPAYRFGRGHPAKRTFQAIRIAVNDELDSIDRALPAAWELLREGGRLAAISFHSLEDRRVKRFLARSRPRLHLPAGASGLPVRARARGGAAHPAGARRDPRGDRAQSPLAFGAPACGAKAPQGPGPR